MARATKRESAESIAVRAIQDASDRAVARLRVVADEAARNIQQAVFSAAGISDDEADNVPPAIGDILDQALANVLRSIDQQAQQIQADAEAAVQRVEDTIRQDKLQEDNERQLGKLGIDPETAALLFSYGIGKITKKQIPKDGKIRRRRFASFEDAINFALAGKSAPLGAIAGVIKLKDGYYLVVLRNTP